MTFRVVIPTAGIGSRLKNLTNHLNKSLVSVSNKPILSHIIDKFPKSCEFVIALGHKGELVKDFLKIAYPNHTFYFANILPYKGKNSGLGYSLLCCKKYLQQPFIFISCDTLIKEKIKKPEYDWIGYSSLKNNNSYRKIEVKGNKVLNILEKNQKNSLRKVKPYIGLAGIYEYKNFWRSMISGKNTAILQGEAYGLREILKKKSIKAFKFTWYDTGSLNSLKETRRIFKKKKSPNILEKDKESIWFVRNQVIKFNTDNQFILNRSKRAKNLKKYVPEILKLKRNMYMYKKIKGNVLSDVITVSLFNKLLTFCEGFWEKHNLSFNQQKAFKRNCRSFYYYKTLDRIKLFYQKFGKQDREESINGQKMPKLEKLLKLINWDNITNGIAGRYHGDFHFENIVYIPNKKKFVFLDWRQDFSKNIKTGDIYYDFAKLLHGLIISHELILKKKFSIKWKKKQIFFNFQTKKINKKCEKIFYEWCRNNGYSISRIRTLTALIYLNIAALHHYPYSLLLYSLGKSLLSQELKKNDT